MACKKCCFKDEKNPELFSMCPCNKHGKKKPKPRDICCKPDNPEAGPCTCAKPPKEKPCTACPKPPSLLLQAMNRGRTYFQRCACLYQFNTDALFAKYGITRYTNPNIFEEYLPPEPPKIPKKRKKLTKEQKEEIQKWKSQRRVRCYVDSEKHIFDQIQLDLEEKKKAELEAAEREKNEKEQGNVKNGGRRPPIRKETPQPATDEKPKKKKKERPPKTAVEIAAQAAIDLANQNDPKKKRKRKKKPKEIDWLELINQNFKECNQKMLGTMCLDKIQKCVDADTSCRDEAEKVKDCLKCCPHCMLEPTVEPKQKKKKKKNAK